MNIVFQIHGWSIDKSIVATAVCRVIKTKWPDADLIVISEFPDVFLCNPFVYKVLRPSELRYFYEQYVADTDTKFFLHDPEKESEYIDGAYTLIESWCKLIDIPYSGELPEMFLNERERSFMANKIKTDKPLFVIQTNHIVYSSNDTYTWFCDLPINIAQQVVNHFAGHYHVVHIRGEKQLRLNNVSEFSGDIRSVAALIEYSEKQLFIDDFCRHLAVAVNKQSVVCWANPLKNRKRYSAHINVDCAEPTRKVDWTDLVLGRHNDQNLSNSLQSVQAFPYNTLEDVFETSTIIDSVKNSNINATINNKILLECNKDSMVAKRLYHLIGQFSFDSVSQILDIGSWHLGQSIEFANIFPSAKIDAFEPVPDSFHLCNKRRAGLPGEQKNRITVHNIALAEKAGDIPFYPVVSELSSVPNIGASSMFQFIDGLNGTPFGQNLVQEEIHVKCTTLDDWCKENGITMIDILWMDVQGAELLVLQGGADILNNTKVILTEVGLKAYYKGHTLKEDIDKFLFSLGFQELESSYEINVPGYEANTIYIKC